MRNVANFVYETSTTTGTSDFTVAAVAGWQRFSDALGTGSSALFHYSIRHDSATEWEVGFGYMSDANTLVRSAVFKSSNSDALVDFAAGDKDVRCGPSIEWLRGGMAEASVLSGGGDDLEFAEDTASVPSGYSWVNQAAGTTWKQENGWGCITAAPPDAINAHNWRMLVRSVPTFSEIHARFIPVWQSAIGSGYCGLVFRDSATGKFSQFGGASATVNYYAAGNWTNPTTFGGWVTGPASILSPGYEYWRIVVNSSTDWDILTSPNGVGWVPVTLAFNPTTWQSIDQVGFGFAPENGAALEQVAFTIRYLRFIP